MAKKAFKVGNRVVGKTKKYQNKHGRVVAVCVGAKGTLTRVRWSSGQVDEVTCYAIDVMSSQQATHASVRAPLVEENNENDEGNEWEDSSDDADSSSCSSSLGSVSIFCNYSVQKFIFFLTICAFFWIFRMFLAVNSQRTTTRTWITVKSTRPKVTKKKRTY